MRLPLFYVKTTCEIIKGRFQGALISASASRYCHNNNNNNNMPQLHHWAEGWAEGRTTFHRATVNDMLLKFQEKLLVKKPSRVFVPLCGKTVDMRWLAEEGHEVIGLEGVTQGIEEFFEEQELAYTESEVPSVSGAKLYQAKDKNIKIYKCDLFKMSPSLIGHVDAIWDRGSLVAVDISEREKYSDILISLLSPGGRILNEVFHYNPEEKTPKGPPNSVPPEAMQKLYGEKFNMELLEDNEYLEVATRFKERGLTWMRQHIRIMVLK